MIPRRATTDTRRRGPRLNPSERTWAFLAFFAPVCFASSTAEDEVRRNLEGDFPGRLTADGLAATLLPLPLSACREVDLPARPLFAGFAAAALLRTNFGGLGCGFPLRTVLEDAAAAVGLCGSRVGAAEERLCARCGGRLVPMVQSCQQSDKLSFFTAGLPPS